MQWKLNISGESTSLPFETERGAIGAAKEKFPNCLISAIRDYGSQGHIARDVWPDAKSEGDYSKQVATIIGANQWD